MVFVSKNKVDLHKTGFQHRWAEMCNKCSNRPAGIDLSNY